MIDPWKGRCVQVIPISFETMERNIKTKGASVLPKEGNSCNCKGIILKLFKIVTAISEIALKLEKCKFKLQSLAHSQIGETDSPSTKTPACIHVGSNGVPGL